MKRFIISILVLMLLITMLSFPVNAVPNDYNTTTIYLEDGAYITITISDISTRTTYTKSGKATYNYYDSSNQLDWSAVLSGSFSYTGSSATCTSSSCNVTIYDTSWYVVDKSSAMLGNTATGIVTMGRKLLGITIEKESINMELVCDSKGNLC